MFKFIINPKYIHLSSFLHQLPQNFEKEGEILYNRRNLIKRIKLESEDINVKRYAVPCFFNKLIYTFFRPTKCERAYKYPEILIKKGFETPEPIAYIEERKWGLLHFSFFISKQSSYKRDLYEFAEIPANDCKEFIESFAKYTATLHNSGIFHRDYSPGNILFDIIDGKYHFSLIDINRMDFGNVSIEKGCSNFARLWGQKDLFVELAKTYASARNADENFCIERVLYYRRKFWNNYKKRHKLKFKLEL
ncbi:MAG: lipopolysaccharide kinase InaA family protein [Parabacteroides sp.]|nr:lipopolysaccharide kinase InaA family protein [Parabacteroides sp.]